jgi:hypothetical protein
METLKFLTLVKYDYDSFSDEWKKTNRNIFYGMAFVYFGEIPQMPGHSYLQDIKTGKPYVLHTENLIPLTEDEV